MSKRRIIFNTSGSERKKLEAIAKSKTAEQRMAMRCKIILMTEEGKTLDEIAEKLDISRVTANNWRRRYLLKGVEGLKDVPRSGRPWKFDSVERLKVITHSCQKSKDIDSWSSRDIALTLEEKDLKISKSTVHRILSNANLKPNRVEKWLASKEHEFKEKSVQVVGLYINLPGNALVISVDEKPAGTYHTGGQIAGGTNIQSLEAKAAENPQKALSPEKYAKCGTQALIASFVLQSEEAVGKTYSKNNKYEFLDFLQEISDKYPDQESYFIMDDFRNHETKEVAEWVRKQRGRIKFHFTPTHASWLNHIELWFSILARKFHKHNIFESVEDMVSNLMAFIENYNKNSKPFKWTYGGDAFKTIV